MLRTNESRTIQAISPSVHSVDFEELEDKSRE